MTARGRGSVPARWTRVVLVCGKCSRKLGGGFGEKGRTSLAKLLRAGAGGKGRKAAYGVIETGCLKLCPKGAIVAIDAARPGEWQLVRPGDPIGTIVARLVLPANGPAADAAVSVARKPSAGL